jgi:hypothetical protein
MNDKAIALTGLNLFDYVLVDVSGETTTKKLWDKLGSFYETKSFMGLIFMWMKYGLKMKDGYRGTDHIDAFNALLN